MLTVNKYKEEKSLLKVREWKEKSYEESKNLSAEEYKYPIIYFPAIS